VQATVQLASFCVVLNSEARLWPNGVAEPMAISPSQKRLGDAGAAAGMSISRLRKDIAQLATICSDYGFGPCDASIRRSSWRGVFYQGPLAALTVTGVAVIATIDAVATAASIHVHSVMLDDLTTEPAVCGDNSDGDGTQDAATSRIPRDFTRRHVRILSMQLPIAGSHDESTRSSFDARRHALRLCVLPAPYLNARAVVVRATNASFATDAVAAANVLSAISLLPVSNSGDDSFDADLALSLSPPALAQDFFAWAWELGSDSSGRVVQGCCGPLDSPLQPRSLLGGTGTRLQGSFGCVIGLLCASVIWDEGSEHH
jgi:hypothetical protein